MKTLLLFEFLLGISWAVAWSAIGVYTRIRSWLV